MAQPAAPPAPPAPPPEGSDPSRYGWFLTGIGSWFGALGMQQVLMSWLVVGALRESPEWVGVAQMSTMLASILLLPLGGAFGDRLDARRLLIFLHLIAAVPILVLAATLSLGLLNLPILIGCGLAMGASNAFSNPARDSLLSRVAGSDLMRAVTGATIAQFGSQGVGMWIAGTARYIGGPLALFIQAVTISLGSLVSRRLPGRPRRPEGMPPPAAPARPGLAEVLAGLRFVLATQLRLVFLLVFAVGLFFGGSYNVVLPLAVRDVYAGGVQEISWLMMMFPAGTILGSLVILKRGGILRKGRALALALGAGGAALIVGGQGLPFPGIVAAIFAWGLAGSVFMNVSRTLFQERAPEAERARVLAVNQLGFMAAGPLGSLLAGFLCGALGPMATLVTLGTAMLVLVGVFWAFTGVRHMR